MNDNNELVSKVYTGNKITIPKEIAKQLKIQEGDFVKFKYTKDGKISLVKVKVEYKEENP